jgi:hypothetical protein
MEIAKIKNCALSGPVSWHLGIAGIVLRITSSDPDLKIEMEEGIGKFFLPPTPSDLFLETRWSDLSAIRPSSEKTFHAETWQLYRGVDQDVFTFTSPVFGPIPYRAALAREKFTRIEVRLHEPYFHGQPKVYPLEYPLLEILFMNYLASGKGALVHACGVVDREGRGHLFIGQSGAGKTTVARFWQDGPGSLVLSDDRIILRWVEGIPWMYGTPWHGEAGISSPDRAPLKGIYFLKKGLENGLSPMEKPQALGHLVACSFPPFYDPHGLNFTLNFFEKILTAVPAYELEFLPSREVVDLVLTNGPVSSAGPAEWKAKPKIRNPKSAIRN